MKHGVIGIKYAVDTIRNINLLEMLYMLLKGRSSYTISPYSILILELRQIHYIF